MHLGPLPGSLGHKLQINYNNIQNQKVENHYDNIIRYISKTQDKQPFIWKIDDLSPKYSELLKNKLKRDDFIVDSPKAGDTDRFGNMVLKEKSLFIYFNNDEIRNDEMPKEEFTILSSKESKLFTILLSLILFIAGTITIDVFIVFLLFSRYY